MRGEGRDAEAAAAAAAAAGEVGGGGVRKSDRKKEWFWGSEEGSGVVGVGVGEREGRRVGKWLCVRACVVGGRRASGCGGGGGGGLREKEGV